MVQIYRAKGYTSQDLLKLKVNGRKCVLNFADYRQPGGTFGTDMIEWTQEETLCRDIPGLYAALLEGREEYLNGLLYTSFVDRDYDVISAPAPLKGSFDKKAKIVLDEMEKHNVSWPIIGWWGCGVYERSKKACLEGFKRVLEQGNYSFKGVLWPDP